MSLVWKKFYNLGPAQGFGGKGKGIGLQLKVHMEKPCGFVLWLSGRMGLRTQEVTGMGESFQDYS